MPDRQLNIESLGAVEELYAQYLQDPAAVEPVWREFFEGFRAEKTLTYRTGPSFHPASIFSSGNGANGHAYAGNGQAMSAAAIEPPATPSVLQDRVDKLVRSYRVRGHLMAKLDPLGIARPDHEELDPAFFGLSEADMDTEVSLVTIAGRERMPLRKIIERLRGTYCGSIGVQFMHIDDMYTKEWLQGRMEASENHIQLSAAQQLRILTKLTDAVVLEEFLGKKYLGYKRFSLEGLESMMPMLQLALDKAVAHGMRGVVIGMAHRGRLNVLANIIGMSPAEVFRNFEGTNPDFELRSGDVKYHLGYSTFWKNAQGEEMYLSLTFNPSHLEYVNPVALGRVRANQDRYGDTAREQGMCILVHGDAAFMGEGICQETLNLSQLEGYRTGGTLHIIANNQIGFTTDPDEDRSTTYASDLAKMLQSPIFHVNGEDPEAVAQVVELAMEFRREFKRDVVIDLYGYRRHGHNEADEPRYTQPTMYAAIDARKSVREGYLDHLLRLGQVTREQADQIAAESRNRLEQELAEVRSGNGMHEHHGIHEIWSGYRGGQEAQEKYDDTGFETARLDTTLAALGSVPDGFNLHPKLAGGMKRRRQMAGLELGAGEARPPLDWAAGEALAYATLALEGHPVRVSGQDSERGTFSHRHAVLHDLKTNARYMPLGHLPANRDGTPQARVEIHNSPLSEAGVMGFEFGYSLDYPEALVVWEAQFGDFANAAQVIIDQFIAGCEVKWDYLSGLTLLLPHGMEGLGPEHSSARLERFLQLAAEDNIQVAVPTTPAQIFHLLRRQVLRKWRKPLIVMTPKGFLRPDPKYPDNPESPLSDFAPGTSFRRILPDTLEQKGRDVEQILLCSGKVYFELAKRRRDLIEAGQLAQQTAILRLEQLYPLHDETLAEAFAPYLKGTPVVWVQEEPQNMGAWHYLKLRYGDFIIERHPFTCASRPASASPATGSDKMHKIEQQRLLEEALPAR